MKRFAINQFLLSCIVILCFGQLVMAQKAAIKIACIGDSVTAGYLLGNSGLESYPSQLQLLMGESHQVGNFGNSGATLLKNGHKPYYKTKEFKDAIAFNPDIAIIHLGLNDTDPRNWPNYKEEFDADYSWLLDALKKQNPAVKIYICRMTPIFNEHPRFKSGTRDWYWQIQSHIETIAKANQVGLIDLHEILYPRPDLFPDALHPTKEGASILAKIVYKNITQDFGGLKLATVFTDNMVLQRNQPITIYGTANGGEVVEVSFKGQKKSATTNQYGKWEVIFPPQIHGGPYEMMIKSNLKNIVLKNILIGDVWFCSGQSNMVFQLQQSENGNEEIKKTLPNAAIRLFNFKDLRETDNTVWDSITLAKTNQLEFFSGKWTECNAENAKDFSAIAYYFAKKITTEENVPIGLIQVAVGGSPIESWIDRYTLEHDDKVVDLLTNWRKSDFIMPWVRTRADMNLKKSTNPKQRHPYDPAYNFEAGITNFTKFPIKGVLWYQGESNAHNIELYEHLLPTMVKSWRKAWNSNFPFYYVQLSSLNRPTWPDFRDAQNRMQKIISNSAMAVSMDFGDSTDVHPIRKKEIGDRLALLALKNTYGKSVIANGPYPLNAVKNKDQIVISFTFSKKIMAAEKKEIIGFELVTVKGKHIKTLATAKNNQIFITIPKGENIKSVYYAWEPFTRANLVNEAGLPCSTFKIEIK
ncbi:GDSL-type esterase/lipase family protein [Flavobacterium galactosidilyticum]|uniref:GDSL-type esterase/lipase family protein n=1 Tax=Flavobacterium galactosidilyticum TaxID=2893886 RepID=UPI001E3C9947|nr:GDSL-type esterase/lipase family protein [Flavobacterium sp. F-340]UFH45693.1 GDSL-type esterase/lipase family protein [Flavobacterium sp. F-340]